MKIKLADRLIGIVGEADALLRLDAVANGIKRSLDIVLRLSGSEYPGRKQYGAAAKSSPYDTNGREYTRVKVPHCIPLRGRQSIYLQNASSHARSLPFIP
jgi:hypothetical protein